MVDDNNSLIEIFVKYDNKNHKFTISKISSVYSLKCAIAKKLEIANIKNISISFGGSILRDDKALVKYMIKNGSTLELRRKVKAGMNLFLKIILFLLALFISLYLFPLIIISGIIPFSVELIESFIVSIAKKVLCWKPSLHNSLASLSMGGFFKLIIKLLKIFFIYIGVYTVFGYAFLILEYALHMFTPSSNFFDTSNKKACLAVHSAKIAGIVLTVFFLLYYFAYQTPNYIANILQCGANMSFITNIIFSPAIKLVRDVADEGKFAPIEMIPFLGEAAISYYVYIGTLVDIIESSLASFIGLGCGDGNFDMNKVKNNFLKRVSGKKFKKNRNSQHVGDSTYQILTKTTPSNGFCSSDRVSTNNCCSEDMFDTIGSTINEVLNNGFTVQELKTMGLEKWAELIGKAFNKKWVNEGVNNFIDAPFFSKFTQQNLEAPIALIMRYLFCNMLELAKSTEGVINDIGTPFMIADSLKSGSASGILVIVIYFIAVIILIILFIYRLLFE